MWGKDARGKVPADPTPRLDMQPVTKKSENDYSSKLKGEKTKEMRKRG